MSVILTTMKYGVTQEGVKCDGIEEAAQLGIEMHKNGECIPIEITKDGSVVWKLGVDGSVTEVIDKLYELAGSEDDE